MVAVRKTCRHCRSKGRKPRPDCRWLCYLCYADLSIRALYPPVGRTVPDPDKRCRHCQHPERVQMHDGKRWGLCYLCYDDPEIRAQYATVSVRKPYDPTEEELDRLIEEQYSNRPAWFDRDYQNPQPSLHLRRRPG